MSRETSDDDRQKAPAIDHIDFLQLLDAFIRRDVEQMPGFAGTINIGVQTDGETRWWTGRFGQRAEIGFVDEPDETADASLLMDGATATRLFHGEEPAPDALLVKHGDGALIKKMFKRYAAFSGALNVRMGAMMGRF